MVKKRFLVILLLSLLALAPTLVGAARSAATLEINRWVIASGGAQVEAGQYTLDGAVGQALVGDTAYTPYQICAGFWCGTGIYDVYLPVVIQSP
jgi:hypothetical protein